MGLCFTGGLPQEDAMGAMSLIWWQVLAQCHVKKITFQQTYEHLNSLSVDNSCKSMKYKLSSTRRTSRDNNTAVKTVDLLTFTSRNVVITDCVSAKCLIKAVIQSD